MTLPVEGVMSLSMIQGEFGGDDPIALSEYYGVAAGIPTEGEIKLSDFYGASAGILAPWCSYDPVPIVTDIGYESPTGSLVLGCPINATTSVFSNGYRMYALIHSPDGSVRTVQGAQMDISEDIWAVGMQAMSDGNNNGILIWQDIMTEDNHGSIPFTWDPDTEEFTYGSVTEDLGGGFDSQSTIIQGVWLHDDIYAFSGSFNTGDNNIGIWLGQFPAAGGYVRGDRLYYNAPDVDEFSIMVSKINDGLIGFVGNNEIKTLTCSGLVLAWAGTVSTSIVVGPSMLVNMPSPAMPTKFVAVMEALWFAVHQVGYIDVDGITPVMVGDVVTTEEGEYFESYKGTFETMSVDAENECLFYARARLGDEGTQNINKIHCPDTGVTDTEVTYIDVFPMPYSGAWGFYTQNNLYIVGASADTDDPIIVWTMTPQ